MNIPQLLNNDPASQTQGYDSFPDPVTRTNTGDVVHPMQQICRHLRALASSRPCPIDLWTLFYNQLSRETLVAQFAFSDSALEDIDRLRSILLWRTLDPTTADFSTPTDRQYELMNEVMASGRLWLLLSHRLEVSAIELVLWLSQQSCR